MFNRAYDGWNVKSLLFIPVFLFSEYYVRKGVLHDLKEIRSEERIAFGNSLSEKRRESGLSQEELGQIIGKSLVLCQEKVQIKNDFFPSCQHS